MIYFFNLLFKANILKSVSILIYLLGGGGGGGGGFLGTLSSVFTGSTRLFLFIFSFLVFFLLLSKRT